MYLKLTEAKTGNRMLVAEDAICVAKENRQSHVVELSTMDGFFYEVSNSIEDIAARMQGAQMEKSCETKTAAEKELRKVARMKKKKMLSPGIEKPVRKENVDIVI